MEHRQKIQYKHSENGDRDLVLGLVIEDLRISAKELSSMIP
jgi:hypothetical protein